MLEWLAHTAIYGEFDVEDIYRLGKPGHVIVGTVKQDDYVQLAVAFEFIAHPHWTAVNILALAGCGLLEVCVQFEKHFTAWHREAGKFRILVVSH